MTRMARGGNIMRDIVMAKSWRLQYALAIGEWLLASSHRNMRRGKIARICRHVKISCWLAVASPAGEKISEGGTDRQH